MSFRIEGGSQTKACLVLEDGTRYEGIPFGAPVSRAGEVVFNTGMLGHPESLTDPTYRGQLLVLTYPICANNGVPADIPDLHRLSKHFESDNIHAAALIVSTYYEGYSHWNSVRSLSEWLRQHNVPGLSGVDTRALAQKLREQGAMKGKLIYGDNDIPFEDPNERNLTAEVSIPAPRDFRPLHFHAKTAKRILLIDCGVSNSVIRLFLSYNVHLRVVPWNHDIFQEQWDGLLIYGGPGNPAHCQQTIENIRKALELEKPKPVFGIQLGHLLMGMAIGAKTYKMKNGNRGLNQPCLDLRTGRCYITTQNHGYAIDTDSLPPNWQMMFVNLNDRSNEGITHTYKPFFGIQFSPDTSGYIASGRTDTEYLVSQFVETVTGDTTRIYTMPVKRVEIHRCVIVLGSGGLVEQAGEYDYLTCQTIKALKEEQIKVVLINPNIATVQAQLADKVYYVPVQPSFVLDVIKREQPDGIVVTCGGHTALSCALSLKDQLKEAGIKVLGTPLEINSITNDHKQLAIELNKIGYQAPPWQSASSVDEALRVADQIGYPVLVHSPNASSSHTVYDVPSMRDIAEQIFSSTSHVTVEKYLQGWKGIEYEVLRDWMDNCISVCDMEHLDQFTIEGNESIVVVPTQTLGTKELALLQSSAIRIVRHFGVVGECNIRFALHPGSETFYVAGVHTHLSRSSALVSKATGYSLAYVAAKLALQKSLPELRNSITVKTTACFEPSLDYCCVKIPCWKPLSPLGQDKAKAVMTTYGEVMAIGRRFPEAIQKAIRMAYPNVCGLEGFEDMVLNRSYSNEEEKKEAVNKCLEEELSGSSNRRIFAIFEALRQGWSIDTIYDMSKLDRWFLQQFRHLCDICFDLEKTTLSDLNYKTLLEAKECGFCDKHIAKLVGSTEFEVRNHRKSLGVLPHVRQMDTCGAEFPAMVDYLYMTYNGQRHDVEFNKDSYVVLASGGDTIGSHMGYDWSVVQCLDTLKREGCKTTLVNCNPLTVCTDTDRCDRLYLEELSVERLLDICELESPLGVLVSFGGETLVDTAVQLASHGVRTMGTVAENRAIAYNHNKFSSLLNSLNILQPKIGEFTNADEALKYASELGFPCLLKLPFSGHMSIAVANTLADLQKYLSHCTLDERHRIYLMEFMGGAQELEIDGVARNGEIINYAIAEHVERVGVNAGDATLVMPAQQLYVETMKQATKTAKSVVRALNINGLFTLRVMVTEISVYVVQCLLQASYSLPFASKVFNVDFVGMATRCMLGKPVHPVNINPHELEYVAIKASVFSFGNLPSTEPLFGIRTASTGQVACFGEDMYESFQKALIATGFTIPKPGSKILLSTGPLESKLAMLEAVQTLHAMGYKLYGTDGTAQFYQQNDIPIEVLYKSSDRKPNALDWVKSKQIDLLVNIPISTDPHDVGSGYVLRRTAHDYNISIITNTQCAVLLVESLRRVQHLQSKTWSEYLAMTPFLPQ